jgi:hypothetical protein
LKHDFLTEVVRLGHQKKRLVMGYFCVGANTQWGRDHPDLSYGTPSTLHIPFTGEYLDYLSRSMADAMKRTGMDGIMSDWVWNPVPVAEYLGKRVEAFTGKDRVSANDRNIAAWARFYRGFPLHAVLP